MGVDLKLVLTCRPFKENAIFHWAIIGERVTCNSICPGSLTQPFFVIATCRSILKNKVSLTKICVQPSGLVILVKKYLNVSLAATNSIPNSWLAKNTRKFPVQKSLPPHQWDNLFRMSLVLKNPCKLSYTLGIEGQFWKRFPNPCVIPTSYPNHNLGAAPQWISWRSIFPTNPLIKMKRDY